MPQPQSTDKATIAILLSSKSESTRFICNIIPDLSITYNLVLFHNGETDDIRKCFPYCAKIFMKPNLDQSLLLGYFQAKYITHLANLQFVLSNILVNGHLALFFDRFNCSHLQVLDKANSRSNKIKRALQYATRIIYENSTLREEIHTAYLFGYPACEHLLEKLDTAAAIIETGLAAAAQNRQEKLDATTLLKKADFDCVYWSGGKHSRANNKITKTYIRSWKSGLYPRRPQPGFHPGIYAQYHDLGKTNMDPFIHYLQQDKPQGPWCWQIIDSPVQISSQAFNRKIALQIHAFYPEMLDDIKKRIIVNQSRPDLFISVKNTNDQNRAQQIFADYDALVDVRIVPNRGRDIGPLLSEFGRQLIKDYDFIGHIHTKYSDHITDRHYLKRWYEYLMINLLGDGQALGAIDTIIEQMHSTEGLNLVFPDDKNAISWAKNRKAAQELAPRLGLEILPNYINFPVGTMFWASKDLLQKFIDLNLDWNDYPEEPIAKDGTMLHAIERLFGVVNLQISKISACSLFGTLRR